MTQIVWDTPGDRHFEAGLDRGVLYVENEAGIPWSGLTSVVETTANGDTKSYYIDGENYLNIVPRGEFRASVSAFYSPPEFDRCDGMVSLAEGLIATQQPRKSFHLSYRTRIGNDILGVDYAYKLHLVYNAVAVPTSKTYKSLSNAPDVDALTWDIHTKPPVTPTAAPTAHFVINSKTADPVALSRIEEILYGSTSEFARMPTPEELLTIFEAQALSYTETRLTNPNRTVLTGSWGTATLTDDARSVRVSRTGWSRTFRQLDIPVSDDFGRTRNAIGWGVATQGGSWQMVGGTEPNNYSVENGHGVLTLDTNSITRHAYLGSYDLTDQTVSAMFRMSQRATPPGGAAFGLTLARVDSSNHYRCKLDVENGNLTDEFGRTSASGWGTMTSGQTWSTAGGVSADYTVDGSRGKLTLPAKNSSRRAYSGSSENGEVLVKVYPSVVATGGAYTAATVLRYKDSNNHYLARLSFTTTGTVTLRLQALIAGATTDLTSETAIPNDTYIAETPFWIRAKITGTQLLARAWKDGDVEPTDWLLSAVDGSVAGAGGYGVRAYAFASNTNANTMFVGVDNYSAVLGDGKDIVTAIIQKQLGGVFTDLASVNYGPITEGVGLRVEGRHFDTQIEMRVWPELGARPAQATVSAIDAEFTQGRSGVFAFTKAGEAAMSIYVSDFYGDGTLIDAPEVTITDRVYALDEPFDGVTVAKDDLLPMIKGEKEDLFDIAMQFLNKAPSVYDEQGIRIRGDAHYGPRNADGTLIEGADFNDYMGVSWTYPDGVVDVNEKNQINSLDCSGYVRMVFGPMGLGMPIRQTGNDGDAIPRQSFDMMDSLGAGASIIANTGVVPTDISALQVGDIVGFDADSNETTSGKIDHVGIYLGLDSNGNPLFVSSRKSIDGPTFSKSGGSSNLNGAGLYATAFRVARRF